MQKLTAALRTTPIAAASLIALGCGAQTSSAAPSNEPRSPSQTQVAAETQWEHADQFRSWTKLNQSMWTSPGHGKSLVNVYVNDIGRAAYTSGEGEMPVGSIIVKEQFANDAGSPGKPRPSTVMVKMEPGSAETTSGGWWWSVVKPTGEFARRGALGACAGCHAGSSRDAVFGVPEEHRVDDY